MCITVVFFFFFFKQKTAYEMRISDWSSDVCSSDLWRQIGGGIVYFVQQLFLDGLLANYAAGAGGLGDGHGPGGVDLGDGTAQLVHARPVFEPRHGKVAACDLRTTFQQLSGNCGAVPLIPIVGGPHTIPNTQSP